MIWVIVSFSLAAAGVKSPTALEYLWNIYCKLLQSIGIFASESANYQQRDIRICDGVTQLGKHLGCVIFLERRSKKRWSQIQVRRHLLIQIRSRKREGKCEMDAEDTRDDFVDEQQQAGQRKCKWRILKSISELNWKVWIQIIHLFFHSWLVLSYICIFYVLYDTLFTSVLDHDKRSRY